MKNLYLYLLKGIKSGILIDIVMSDEIKSHRYYFIDNNLNFYRVKSVDNLIEFLDHNDVNIVRMTNEETYRLYDMLYNKDNKKKEKEINYPGLTKMSDFDIDFINKYFNKRLIKYYNKLTENYQNEKKVK